MTFRKFGKERESLTGKGENYKQAIKKYLENIGFKQITDSFVEGHFPDMVFVNKEIEPGREFWVEAKAKKVSPNSQNFVKELFEYLKTWTSLHQDKRFKFMIFIEEASNEEKWKSLFAPPIDKNEIDNYIEENKNTSSKLDITKEEIYLFFQSTKVNVATTSYLKSSVETKKKRSSLTPSQQIEELTDELQRRKYIIEEKTEMVLNFFRFKTPSRIIKMESKYDDVEDIFEECEGILPPFHFDGRFIYSFCKKKDLTPFDKVTLNDDIIIKTNDLAESNQQMLVRIINDHLHQLMRHRGLDYYKSNYGWLYFHPVDTSERNDIQKKEVVTQTGQTRWIAKPYFKNEDNSELNFVEHRGVLIKPIILWDESYVIINPKRHFTSDGKNAIEGERKDKLDRKFRSSPYSRSNLFRQLVRFWKYYAFDKDIRSKKHKSWFEIFDMEDLTCLDVRGKPESIDNIDEEQRLLYDWGESSVNSE